MWRDNLPDGEERASFNANETRALFGVSVETPDGRPGHIVAVDVRDQFGLGDDVWLIQIAEAHATVPNEVVAAVGTYCRTTEEGF